MPTFHVHPPSPTCQQPWGGGSFWGPTPRAPQLCLPQFSSQHLPLSLTTFFSLRPHWPLVQPLLPEGQLRAVSRGSIPLQGSLPPSPWEFPDDGGGARSGATALGHHGLGSAAADGHRHPGPWMPTQRREEAPCLCHHPRGRGPSSHPFPAFACHYCSSSGGPFSRGSTPFRPTLQATGAPK